MLRDANLFDKFASHFLEHFIFHTGIIQSLILVTCSVQDSLFTEANASTAPLSVFRFDENRDSPERDMVNPSTDSYMWPIGTHIR